MPEQQEISRIRISARLEFLPAVVAFVRDLSVKLGLTGRDIERLELVVEEACVNVIEHAFDPGEQGSFEVAVLRKPGQVVVAVEDQGLPFDFKALKGSEQSGLGMILMNAFADEVRFLNLGRQGKRVELIKNLPYKDAAAYFSGEEKESKSPPVSVSPDMPFTLRLMNPDDSIGVARCVYRSYGYTYGSDDIYFPDREKELLESGLTIPCVAVTPDNEVIGHLSMTMSQPRARIGETGQAVVDPRYRGRGLFAKMKAFMMNHAREIGMYGIYSEPVAVHPYTQKGNLALGAHDTGFLLGFTPATMFFKKIQEKEHGRRQTAVLFYTRINEEPCRDVYPPFHHQTMIRRIYEINGLKQNIVSAASIKARAELPPTSRLDVRVQAAQNRSFMLAREYGVDFVGLVQFRLRELCLRRVDCIYLDLPLSLPSTARFCASLEMMGFFFAGIIPELLEGDVLRLQYLNNVDVALKDISVASDFGKELLAYIVKSRDLPREA